MKVRKRPNVVGNVYIADLGVTVGDGGIDLSLHCSVNDIRKSYTSGRLRSLKKQRLITTVGLLPSPHPAIVAPPPPPSKDAIKIPDTTPVEVIETAERVVAKSKPPPVPSKKKRSKERGSKSKSKGHKKRS